MDTVLLFARLLLAAVFLASGLGKLFDLHGSRRAVRDFGVPTALAHPLGTLLPLAELLVAVALLPASWAWWGALAALAFLVVFTVGIGLNLARGRRPDCHCFGAFHSAPIGPSTLVRNVLLAAVAALIVGLGYGDAGPSGVAWLGELSVGERAFFGIAVLLALAMAAMGWFMVQLVQQNGRVLARVGALEAALAGGGAASADVALTASGNGLPIGSRAPDFSLPSLEGETLTLEALRRASGEASTLLVFTDPDCRPCASLLPDLGRWQRELESRLTVALISHGTREANRSKIGEHGLRRVLLQGSSGTDAAYKLDGTPTAVLVRPDGTVGSGLAEGPDQIRELVTGALNASLVPLAMVNGTIDGRDSGHGHDDGHRHDHGNGQAHAHDHDHAAHDHPNGQVNGTAQAPTSASIGRPAPALRLPDLDGNMVDLAAWRGGRTLVLFWSTTCGFCDRMLDDLREWEVDRPAGAPRLLVVSNGTVEANRAQGLQSVVVLDPNFRVGRAFGVDGTPGAVLVDEDGKIASGEAGGATAVLALANGHELPADDDDVDDVPRGPRVGEPAPPLRLRGLDGKMVDLASRRGTETLLLFWDPSCRYCSEMLDDLKAWDANPPAGAPELLLVSSGSARENRALGLRSPIVLDRGFQAGRAFGADGTPMAILIDAEGNVASPLVAGAEDVLELARGGSVAHR